MKKILTAFFILFAFSLNAQVKKDTSQLSELVNLVRKEMKETKMSNLQIEKEVQSFRKNYLNAKNIVPLKEYKNFIKKSILPCDNGSFESNNLSGWTPISYYNGSGLPLGSNLYLTPPNPVLGASYGINVLDNSNEKGRHWLNVEPLSSGFDDWLSTSTPSYLIPIVPAASGNYSLRLGNRGQLCAADAVAKTFTVTSSNAILHFKYFYITQQYHETTAGADDIYSTFFLARAFDASTGTILKQKIEKGVSGNIFLTPTNHLTANYYNNDVPALAMANNETIFRDWTCVTWDLTDFIGKDVTLEFINSDCGAGGHKSVTYLDDVCGTCSESPIEDGYITLNATDTCGFKGPQNSLVITGTYAAPIVQFGGTSHVGTISGLVINFYQGSSVVASYPIPSSTITAGSPNTFTVNVPATLFSSVTGCVDIVAEADFASINSVTGTAGSYHVESGIPRGIRYGKDNDFCIQCPCFCKQAFKPILYTASGNPNNPDTANLTCGATYTDKLQCFKYNLVYIDNPCGENCSPDSVVTTIKYPNGSTTVAYDIISGIFIANQVGTYNISIKIKCNGIWCNECKFIFIQTKKCEPPCDNCKTNGTDKVYASFEYASSTASIHTYPTATTLNAKFKLSGGTDTYTQVRVNLVDFNIQSDNPDCLQCYNNPNQWGSILQGTITGFAPTITSYTGVLANNINNNPREIVFNTTSPTALPTMTNLDVTFNLPGINTISCCCIKVVAFVKITFRNNKCEECSKIVKMDMTFCPGVNGGNPTITYNTPNLTGHPQFKMHNPNKADAMILIQNINGKSNK